MHRHPRFRPFHFEKWIEDHRDFLKPPVGNKMLHDETSGMIVMVVGGPNTRVDFHDDPVEEWFYQIKGDMLLKIAENGEIYDVPIREGEVFLMPPHALHAPQRPQAGSIGLVVEAPRQVGMMEGFEWYCFNCGKRVHRVEVSLSDPSMIVTVLPKVFQDYHDDMAARQCADCGEIHPGKGQPPDGWVSL